MANLYRRAQAPQLHLDGARLRRDRLRTELARLILGSLFWNGFTGLSLDVFTKMTRAARRRRRPVELHRRQPDP